MADDKILYHLLQWAKVNLGCSVPTTGVTPEVFRLSEVAGAVYTVKVQGSKREILSGWESRQCSTMVQNCDWLEIPGEPAAGDPGGNMPADQMELINTWAVTHTSRRGEERSGMGCFKGLMPGAKPRATSSPALGGREVKGGSPPDTREPKGDPDRLEPWTPEPPGFGEVRRSEFLPTEASPFRSSPSQRLVDVTKKTGGDERDWGPATSKIVGTPFALPEVLHALKKAEKSIWLKCYTIDHPEVLLELEKAIKRGVSLKLLVDRGTLHSGSPVNEIGFLEQIYKAAQTAQKGVEVREYVGPRRRSVTAEGFPARLHAKSGIVDGCMCWTGSLTLTENSATYLEQVALHYHPENVNQQMDIFHGWWLESERCDLAAARLTVQESKRRRSPSLQRRGK